MMERLLPHEPRRTEEEKLSANALGLQRDALNIVHSNIITHFELMPEGWNKRTHPKEHQQIKDNKRLWDDKQDDADYIVVSFGSASVEKSMELARERGISRTLPPHNTWPFPNCAKLRWKRGNLQKSMQDNDSSNWLEATSAAHFDD